MKKLMMVAVTAVAVTGLSAETSVDKQDEREKELYRTGGIVYEPNSRKGEIVYVNCQSAAKEEWLQFSITYFAEHTGLTILLKSGTFDLKKPEIQGSVSLFVVDDPELPSILYAPDGRWSMVNVAPLKCDKPAFFEARVKKQLTRAFAYLCGAADSRYSKSLVGAIDGLNGLDRHSDHRLQADVMSRFRRYMHLLGVTPPRYTAYANACREGWAEQPTNKYQKAVWDKVHEIPSKPIKIEFNEKRDKGK